MNFWFDAQQTEMLIERGISIAAAAYALWKTTRTEQRVIAVHRLVTGNDTQILEELGRVDSSVKRLAGMFGDRRKAPPGTPPPTWAGAGRRAEDREQPPQ